MNDMCDDTQANKYDYADLAAADEQIRRSEAKIDDVHLQLGTAASVVVEMLRYQVHLIKDVATVLFGIEAPWAQACAKRLREAALEAQIKRQDREAKILLGLPGSNEEAIREWLRSVRLVDENSQWLATAARYGLRRLRALVAVKGEVAIALANVDAVEAQACAAQLRG